MKAEARTDHQAHLEAGGCRLCRGTSMIFAAVSLSSAAFLVIEILAEEAEGACHYMAVLSLVVPALLAIRITGWHQTRLYLKHIRDQDPGA